MRTTKSIVSDLIKDNIDKEKIIYLLSNSDEELFLEAYKIKEKYVGKKVYLRGLIEFSNICKKNCYYCGIRRDNNKIKRYNMSDDEIIESALFAYNSGFGSIVLQSGERDDSEFIERMINLLREIKKKAKDLGITLCVGEETEDTYKKFFDAGAHRYLLRIETSNRELYKKIHPEDHSFEKRINCIKNLKKIGYQTGTGVMIGLPFQTIEDLADDILFFVENNIDMIGMGPYIEHPDTPLANVKSKFSILERFEITLRMIAISRLIMKDINIAATTALQALDPIGREKGLLAGANVIMPNITPAKYRENYKLYDGKPCINENSEECKNCLVKRIQTIGEEIGYNLPGDPIHYFRRTKLEK